MHIIIWLRTLNGFSDGIEGREVGEPRRRGPQELGHLVVVVVLELEVIVLVLDQVLGTVVWAVRRVDSVTAGGRRRVARGGVVIVVADGPVAHVLALDHVGGHGRPGARILRYPVVVYRTRADRLLGLLVQQRLVLLQVTTVAVLFTVHGRRRADRVRLRLAGMLRVLLVLAGRVLRVRVRPDFALDHLAAGQLFGVVVLLLLDGRKPLFGLTVGR